MLSDALRMSLKKLQRIHFFVWLAEFMTLAVYVFIAHVATGVSAGKPLADNNLLTMIFSIAGGTLCVTGFILRHYAYSQARARAWLAREHPLPPTVPATLSPEEKPFYALGQSVFVLYIMGLGMMNACAVFGLVLSMMQHDPNALFPLVGGAAVTLALSYPRLENFVEEAQMMIKGRTGNP